METNIGFLASDIGRLMRKRLDIMSRPFGVTGAQWRVLIFLRRMPGSNQAALAGYLEVEPITACRMVDRMVAADLIERQPDPDDRRAWQLFITDTGTKLLDMMDETAGTMIEIALQGLSEKERSTAVTLLDRIRTNLLEQSDPVEANNG